MLTDVPIGAFTAATVLDVTMGNRAGPAVERFVAVGLAAAVPTALSGVSDWSDTYGVDQRMGLVHGSGNAMSLALFSTSLVCRRSGAGRAGRVFGLAGLAVMAGAGYLGGHLSFARGVGVNNAFHQHGPHDWTAVLDEANLVEGTPTMVTAGDATVLLYKRGPEISAISSRCSHAGGPLAEGTVDDRPPASSVPGTRACSGSTRGRSSTVPPRCLSRPTRHGPTPAGSDPARTGRMIGATLVTQAAH